MKQIDYYEYLSDFNNERLNHYVEPTDALNWKIEEEVDSILGLTCQLATVDYGGRTWKGYFSSDIPISDGPYKFTGLPGLIVKIQSEELDWIFTLREIRTNENREIAFNGFPKRSVYSMSKDDFMKKTTYFTTNKITIREAQGHVKFNSAANREAI